MLGHAPPRRCRSDAAVLIAHVTAGRPEAADLTKLLTLRYLGFQIGWWSYATEPSALSQRDLYIARADALLAERGTDG